MRISDWSSDVCSSDLTANDLSDYIVSQIQDPVSRINGVGELQIFGTQYSMRIWVDPLKLRSYNLTIADVSTAVSAQNAQVSAGQIGQLPASKEQQLNATVSVQRSEEHTSELQSLMRISYAVFCLKKKTK